jgi:hypothetical protein
VPGMKLTPNAAMRARDVSRPRPEHLADAEAAEARAAGSVERGSVERGRAETGSREAGRAETGGSTGAVRDERPGRPGFPRRRRGRPSR